jgi:spore maturation protein CgeB
MRILIYGECESVGSGAWCYAETLREMGHNVATFSDGYGLDLYRTSLLARGYRKLRKRLIETHRMNHVGAFIGAAAKLRPEIVLVLKGLHIGPADVVALKRTGAWVVNLNHDDFFTLNSNNWTQLQRAALPAYDFILTTREVNVSEVRPFNPNVEFFPFAYYPPIHQPVEILDSEASVWCNDVVFVGGWEKERCDFLESLVSAVPAKYAIWGAHWNRVRKSSPLLPFIRRTEIWTSDMAKTISGAKVSLAFLRKENRDDYTQRTFEIPACGGVLLAERTERQKKFFAEGKEAEFFDPKRPEELIEKVRLLLGDDDHRAAVRRAGREALLKQKHTYRDRLERLIQLSAEVDRRRVA